MPPPPPYAGLNKLFEKLDKRHTEHLGSRKTPSFTPYPRLVRSPAKGNPRADSPSWAVKRMLIESFSFTEPLLSSFPLLNRSSVHAAEQSLCSTSLDSLVTLTDHYDSIHTDSEISVDK